MKLWWILLFVYLLNMIMNVSMDLLTGMNLNQSLQTLLHPFGVTIGSEVVITFILICIWIIDEFVFYIQERKQMKNK
ncbi:hypothetical protein [Bacillus sp. BP-3]|uniref:hypothetical protein n=1 Tax=Bacillus sp. BP-3 TaxID=3022773 RepID=UPI00232C8F5F|nr:hypothetical protein [Bacillus sp. BP-3]MDC2867868.1 hypothetical protein [Bacillus sp. BP-3]